MKDGFFYSEQSPDPFGGLRRFPWARVVHKTTARTITDESGQPMNLVGQETVLFDFLDPTTAATIARVENLKC